MIKYGSKHPLVYSTVMYFSTLPIFAGERKNDDVGIARVSDRPSPALVEVIKGLEGCQLKAYRCTGNRWTVGFGHTEGVTSGTRLRDQDEAVSILLQDLEPHHKKVQSLFADLRLNESQTSALTSFRFNLGSFSKQFVELMRKKIPLLNDPETREPALQAIAHKFSEYCNSGGKFTPGLLRRRMSEFLLFVGDPSPVVTTAEYKELEKDARASFAGIKFTRRQRIDKMIDLLIERRGIAQERE